MSNQINNEREFIIEAVTRAKIPTVHPDAANTIDIGRAVLAAYRNATATKHTAAQPLDLDKLSANIVNLPSSVPRAIAANGASRQAYKEGHRDARHAAAELVNEQAALIAQARAARLDTTASATGELIAAAEKNAEAYDGDDREGIKTDVINAFYQGAAWQARATLAPVAAQQAAAKPYGWVQFIDGQQTQNFARNEAELENVKWVTGLSLKGEHTVEYVQVFDRPTAAAKAPAAQADARVVAALQAIVDDMRVYTKPVNEEGETVADVFACVLKQADDALAASPASTPEASQQAAAVAAPIAEVNDRYSRGGYNDEINVLLPVGTKLYAAPTAAAATTSEDVRDAARYRILRQNVRPADVNLAMTRIPPTGQSSAERIDFLCDLYFERRATQQEGGNA